MGVGGMAHLDLTSLYNSRHVVKEGLQENVS